ncbi:MAG: tetratricopeptide repeat protein [Vicinamibacteria bacterium]|jgi:Flp pilus assembly protein TadD|nr:tetratricopeptide repeat protein [Vicinamibacteria bacterium]
MSKKLEKAAAHSVEAYEKALKAFWKKDYEKAQELLAPLEKGEAVELAERARTYLAVCAKHTDKKGSFKPKTAEEHVAYGSLLHNRGEFAEAQKLFAQATSLAPQSDVAHYCLAAAAARNGDDATARKALQKAVDLSPESRVQARRDADFEALREDEEIAALLEA